MCPDFCLCLRIHIPFVDFLCESVSSSVSEIESDVPQNLSVSGKRSISTALERDQHKKAKGKHGSAQKRTPCKAVLENVMSRAPWAPEERIAAKQGKNGLDHHQLRRQEVEGTPRTDQIFHSAREVELRYQQDEFDGVEESETCLLGTDRRGRYHHRIGREHL